MALEKLDLHHPSTFINGFPHEYFREVRKQTPIFFQEEHPSWKDGYWNLTRHNDMYEVSRDSETFKCSPHPFMEAEKSEDQSGSENLLISLDPPDHTRMRKLVNKGFTPKRVQDLTERIQNHVDRIIDNVADKKGCDMVSDIAVELPLQVIADLVGVPVEDRHQIFEWTEMSFGFDETFTNEQRAEATMNMYIYAEGMCELRKEERQDDLISLLLDAEIDDHSLEQQQINLFFLLLQNAGSETTRNLITSGTLALLNNRDQLEKLQKNLELVPTAVEEMLRITTPVMQFKRTASVDTIVAGQKIKKGDKIFMWYPSGNRDENEFENHDQLDVARDPNHHISFGAGGPHFCLGASLARLEAKLMFEAILTRFVDLDCADDGTNLPRVYSNMIDGYSKMPITWSEVRDKDGKKLKTGSKKGNLEKLTHKLKKIEPKKVSRKLKRVEPKKVAQKLKKAKPKKLTWKKLQKKAQ